MFKVRGIRLVVEYFFYNHLFDIFHKTDTHGWKQERPEQSTTHEIYMATWQKDIKLAMSALRTLDNRPVKEADLIDLGCGKGKLLLVWSKMYHNHDAIQGVEYDEELLDICRNNFKMIGLNLPRLVVGDASNVILEIKNDRQIYFMFNPFGADIVLSFFKNNYTEKMTVIYFNPIHYKILEDLGLMCVYERNSYRNGSSFQILSNDGYVLKQFSRVHN
jgi:hypothetical protein